jgi:uncharacterized membrane protein YeaQ/YmgE (transglycosylase-associated protein family)
MIGMHFAGFLTLLILSLIAGVVVHYAIRYRVLGGFDGFLAKWVSAWVGAWLGSPVLGHWFARVNIGSLYIIPALIGAFVGAFVPAAVSRAAEAIMMTKTMMSPELDVHKTQQAA